MCARIVFEYFISISVHFGIALGRNNTPKMFCCRMWAEKGNENNLFFFLFLFGMDPIGNTIQIGSNLPPIEWLFERITWIFLSILLGSDIDLCGSCAHLYSPNRSMTVCDSPSAAWLNSESEKKHEMFNKTWIRLMPCGRCASLYFSSQPSRRHTWPSHLNWNHSEQLLCPGISFFFPQSHIQNATTTSIEYYSVHVLSEHPVNRSHIQEHFRLLARALAVPKLWINIWIWRICHWKFRWIN